MSLSKLRNYLIQNLILSETEIEELSVINNEFATFDIDETPLRLLASLERAARLAQRFT